MTVATRTKPQVAIMNAVHDLPVLVARDLGFFKEEGLDLEFVTTPYARERWDDTYRWTVKWNMTVPGATYDNTVDNRAWS